MGHWKKRESARSFILSIYCSVLCTLHVWHVALCMFVLYTLHSILCTLHVTLYTLHVTLHFTLYTLHFYLTLYTLRVTLYSLYVTRYALHFTLYALHCTLKTRKRRPLADSQIAEQNAHLSIK